MQAYKVCSSCNSLIHGHGRLQSCLQSCLDMLLTKAAIRLISRRRDKAPLCVHDPHATYLNCCSSQVPLYWCHMVLE